MTSNTSDSNNEILTSDKDRGIHNIQPPTNPTLEQIQHMQVARKESSSGFMLLSVRHTSNIGSLSNGREMHPLVENYDENYVRAASMQATSNAMVSNNPDMGRQFSSTMSLEAEEYDNNEEDDPDPHSEPNLFSHNQQQQQFVVRNPPSNFIPAGMATVEPSVNGAQVVDGLRPVAVSNLSQIQLPPGAVPIQAAVIQSPQQPPPPIPAVPVIFRQINGHESTLIPVTSLDSLTQLQSAGILPDSTQGPRPSVQLTDIPPFKYSDPSGVPPAVIAITSVAAMAGAAQAANLAPVQQTVSAVLNQPSIQRIIDQMSAEPLRSVSDGPLSNPLLTSLNAPIQPASRFRKARIHETVEQWSSKRISLHDCHLKAVPDWVTYLQSKPIDTTFNHPIAQQGRCLYCFVPGGFGSQCNKHNHNQSFSKFLVGSGSKHHHTRSATCSLPTVPETSEQSHIIQAAFTAYRAATQQGYNLKNLLSTWDSGERSANKTLLERFERSQSPKTSNNPHSLKPNASEPVLASSASTATQHQHHHVEAASHNSTDINVNMPTLGNEEFSNEGLTTVAQPTVTTHQHHPSELERPQAPNGAPQTQKVSTTHVTDPSAAYLRRQITLNSEEGEAGARSECVQQVQPPSTLSVAMPDQRLIAPPPTSPTLATVVVGGGEQTSAAAPAVSPRSMRSFSGTTIASVQLSPDTEMSGGIDSGFVAAIPQLPVLSTAGSHNLDSIISPSLDHILPGDGVAVIAIPQTQAQQQQAPNPAAGVVGALPVVTTAADATTDLARTITPSVISNLQVSTGSHPEAATSLDFSTASRNICKAVEAVANAYAPALANGQMNVSSPSSMQISASPPPLSQPPHPAMASNSPSSNNNTNTTTTSVPGNLQAPVPKCMDVIRGAIMETLQDHYAQLSSEIEALRATVNSLQQENIQLRTYKQAFDNLRPYLPSETWEQMNQQMRATEIADGNQAAVTAAATAEESIAYQSQPQTQHFFSTSNVAATVATVQQQLNSAFQVQQQQPVNLSPSHILPPPPPPQNNSKTDPH